MTIFERIKEGLTVGNTTFMLRVKNPLLLVGLTDEPKPNIEYIKKEQHLLSEGWVWGEEKVIAKGIYTYTIPASEFFNYILTEYRGKYRRWNTALEICRNRVLELLTALHLEYKIHKFKTTNNGILEVYPIPRAKIQVDLKSYKSLTEMLEYLEANYTSVKFAINTEDDLGLVNFRYDKIMMRHLKDKEGGTNGKFVDAMPFIQHPDKMLDIKGHIKQELLYMYFPLFKGSLVLQELK